MIPEKINMPGDKDIREDSQYPDWPTVLRVEESSGKYSHQYLALCIGDVGGEYNSLLDQRRFSLTRSQVAELTKHLIDWLAAQ